jgi:hypothetical protein
MTGGIALVEMRRAATARTADGNDTRASAQWARVMRAQPAKEPASHALVTTLAWKSGSPQQGQRAPWHSWEYEFISLLASNPWVLLEFITHNQILEAKQALNWIRQLEFFCAPQNKGSFCRFRVHHL